MSHVTFKKGNIGSCQIDKAEKISKQELNALMSTTDLIL